LMNEANGRVLVFYLSGPMLFGVAKAIAREHSAMRQADVLIVDLSDVPFIGVTASLAVENVVKDALDQRLKVYVVGATGQTLKRLEKIKLVELVGADSFKQHRIEALQEAVEHLEPMGADPLPKITYS
ncbi:MAG: SulP family inorganic anion transporter, partial [Desertifilum sp. SIO1I2]|nr:SulP family inorganic anion transporter [Desertifilum sp. SIO1I2]